MSWMPRLRPAFTFVAIIVVIGSLSRFLFLLVFGDGTTSADALRHAFYVGLKFDIRLAVLAVVPFFALSRLPLLDPSRSSRALTFWSFHFALLTMLTVLTLMSDFGHYDYLQERLNADAFRFLQNPVISMGMVWQTYSVMPAALILVVTGVAAFHAIRQSAPSIPASSPGPSRKTRVFVATVATVAVIAGIYGKISWYPLRWSDAYFSTAAFPADLSLNPVLSAIDTWSTAEAIGDAAMRAQLYYEELTDYLGVEHPNPANLDLTRQIEPTPITSTRPNVVVIMMESFAAHLTGFYGNPLRASPEFDRIADNGLVFSRYYTPGVGTAHGVYTMLTGIPDVSLNRTASRNPNAIRQHIILNEFTDYEKFYFLGGSANWANIRALLQFNIEDLKLYEEGDFPNSPRTDVWGISDLHLFEEANRVLRDTEDPFFAIVHLSGNHRPYTIPADNRGFTPETIDDELAIENGFDKQDGYNSFRFMDHSLGFFMRLAGNEAYFDNTIFVLTADNGEIGKVPGPLHVEEASRISNHHAPFVIFSPRLESEPQRIEAIATQMDLLPTIAGAAGVPATNIALGRNMLDPRFADGFAFIHRRWGTGSELVILDDEYMYTSKRGVQPPVLEKFDAANQEWRVIANEPDQAASMETYAESFYQTAKYLMFGDKR